MQHIMMFYAIVYAIVLYEMNSIILFCSHLYSVLLIMFHAPFSAIWRVVIATLCPKSALEMLSAVWNEASRGHNICDLV